MQYIIYILCAHLLQQFIFTYIEERPIIVYNNDWLPGREASA